VAACTGGTQTDQRHRCRRRARGDVTDDERKKAVWFLAHDKAALAQMELGNANDNQPKMDEELADMIAGEW
jgi:hypothetical protein